MIFFFFCFTCNSVDDHIGDSTHGDTFRNAVQERHCDNRDKCRDCFSHVVEVNLGYWCEHQNPTMIRTVLWQRMGLPGRSGITAVIIRKGWGATREVSPVRPPSATPEALSTKVVTVESTTRSTYCSFLPSEKKSAFDVWRVCLLCQAYQHLEATPIRVPRVSNISTNKIQT